eukprot:CAMPEP_0170493298 /NCGR_PEP_ID=MMETSP0208-20121228/13670_1 /TAXON_ID=197538 /ORGANISM="Strombidium inclinatum, Strain S3" /LENGTH=54 /DNA_ID=CAMNT_0010769205 /DNA_START=838 /DNA_END=1002 /DNA_ORIENTATION=-
MGQSLELSLKPQAQLEVVSEFLRIFLARVISQLHVVDFLFEVGEGSLDFLDHDL